MISVIICSVSDKRLQETKDNIARTIGDVGYEIIAYDNSCDNIPIAKVYNTCAHKARYENLFFVHEDVRFLKTGWGGQIEEKLKEPDCGAEGFVGSDIKPAVYSGWDCGPEYEVSHYHYILTSSTDTKSVPKTYLTANLPIRRPKIR